MSFSDSNPGFVTGQRPTATQWNSYFAEKVDVTNGDLTDPTFHGTLAGTPAISGAWNFTGTPTFANGAIFSSGATFASGVFGIAPNNILTLTPGAGSTNAIVFTRSGTGGFRFTAGSGTPNSLTISPGATTSDNINLDVSGTGAPTFRPTGGNPIVGTGGDGPQLLRVIGNYQGTFSGGETGMAAFNITGDNSQGSILSNISGVHVFGGADHSGTRYVAHFTLTHAFDSPNALSTSFPVIIQANGSSDKSMGGTSANDLHGTFFGQNWDVVLSRGATWWTQLNAMGEANAVIQSSSQNATFTGSVTNGDQLEITFAGSYTGFPVTVSVTAVTGNSLSILARELRAAIVTNPILQAADVSADLPDGAGVVLRLSWQAFRNLVTISTNVTGAATEIITLGTANTNGATVGAKVILNAVHKNTNTAATITNRAHVFRVGDQPNATPIGGWDKYLALGNSWAFRPESEIIGYELFDDIQHGEMTLPPTMKNGVNLRWINFTQAPSGMGYPFWAPGGWRVDGSGGQDIGGARLQVDATTGGLSIQARGWVGSGNATVTNGAGPGAGSVTNRIYVGEIIFDEYNGQHVIATVNSSGGAATVTTVAQPSSSDVTIPTNPITTVGGSSNGAITLSPTWVAATLLALNPDGGEVSVASATGEIGFFGTAPIVKPTGVAVSAAGIHAALVSLGLIAA